MTSNLRMIFLGIVLILLGIYFLILSASKSGLVEVMAVCLPAIGTICALIGIFKNFAGQ